MGAKDHIIFYKNTLYRNNKAEANENIQRNQEKTGVEVLKIEQIKLHLLFREEKLPLHQKQFSLITLM